MKIKRYIAASMRAALAQVRAEQGPDAVILSSRRVEEGLEVIAAVDYDEALFVDATQKRSPPAAPAAPASGADFAAALREALPAASVVAPAAAPAAAPIRVPVAPSVATPALAEPRAAFAPAPPPVVAAPVAATAAPAVLTPVRAASAAPAAPPAVDRGYVAVRREIKDLRDFLHGELAQMTWNDKRLRNPLQARVLDQLTHMDIAPDLARLLAAQAPRRTSLKDPSNIPLALLARQLRVIDKLGTVNAGVIALVGPTGAGKTTTIAKLAARWSMKHGSDGLALVSTDSYRIGAREQLATYARLLDAPMYAANDGKELARVLARLKSKKLVLIDTAGMGPRDVRLSEQLSALQLGAARARVFLTLPAQGEAHALEEIVRSFERVAPVACILTKLDEAASLGGVLSAAIRHRLRIAYLCNGQRVPEDLHAAYDRRVWLVRCALKLKEKVPRVNQTRSALHLRRADAHA